MEKEFVRISGKDYAEAGIASGELKPVIAVKFARVLARRGQIGEEVIDGEEVVDREEVVDGE